MNKSFIYITQELLGFNLPISEVLITIILLYAEILFIGLFIVLILIDTIVDVIDRYSYEKNLNAYSFSKRMESFLDLFFLLLPTFIVIIILVPSLGFLYMNEYAVDLFESTMTVDVIGHQ